MLTEDQLHDVYANNKMLIWQERRTMLNYNDVYMTHCWVHVKAPANDCINMQRAKENFLSSTTVPTSFNLLKKFVEENDATESKP